MVLDVRYAQKVSIVEDQITHSLPAKQLELLISPTDSVSVGGLRKLISLNPDEAFISDNRKVQTAQIELTKKDAELIFGEGQVNYSDYEVAVHLRALDAIGGVELASVSSMSTDHTAATTLSPHVLTEYFLPTRPEITRVTPGDNKIAVRFTTVSATQLIKTGTNIKVHMGVQKVSTSNTGHVTNHMVPVPAQIGAYTHDSTSNLWTIDCVLHPQDSDGNYLLENKTMYEVAVAVGNSSGDSELSEGKKTTPSNRPAQLTDSSVKSHWTYNGNWDDAELNIDYISFDATAAHLIAEFNDSDARPTNTCQVYWGVRDDNNHAEGAYKGISSGRSNSMSLTEAAAAAADLGVNVIKLPIPRSWFQNGEKTIELQVRVGQTTTDSLTGVATEYFGDLMDAPQTAYLVNRDVLTFDADVGPLPSSPGIKLEEIQQQEGNQRWSVSGKVLHTLSLVSVTWELSRGETWMNTTGSGIPTLQGDTWYQSTGNLSYNVIKFGVDEGAGDLTFEASIRDPNDNTTQLKVTQSLKLYPIKTPTGTVTASIYRPGLPGQPPRCRCDHNFSAETLHGWGIDSLQLRVYSKDFGSGSKLAYKNDLLPLSDRNGSFEAMQGLVPYNHNPGMYECRYTAHTTNFNYNDMTPNQKTLYAEQMSKWNIYISSATNWAGTMGITNFYRAPEIISVSLDGGKKKIHGRTNGSFVPLSGYQSIGFVLETDEHGNAKPGQYTVSNTHGGEANVLTGDMINLLTDLQGRGNVAWVEEEDAPLRWDFNITMEHRYLLVEGSTAGDGFEGIVIINPSDAPSAIGLLRREL
jgi:type 1 fimbria pilin